MTITNGLITLDDFKAYMTASGTSLTFDPSDDAVIERQIEAASAVFESLAGRSFLFDSDEIRYYDTPRHPSDDLLLDKDFVSITAVTNGDGTSLDTDDYYALPLNDTPKYAIRLKPTTGIGWATDGGNPFGVITVEGQSGYSATVPADIAEVCKELVRELYQARTGQGEASTSVVTTNGIVEVPVGMINRIEEVVRNKRRVGFA